MDKDGNPTTDPNQAVSLLPFGAHKGYGFSLINEIVGGFIGGSLPTIRNRWDKAEGDKGTCVFFFQVIHPDAINGGAFAKGRNQAQNVKAVIEDVLGHGNEKSMLPGQSPKPIGRGRPPQPVAFSSARPRSTPSTNSPPKRNSRFGKLDKLSRPLRSNLRKSFSNTPAPEERTFLCSQKIRGHDIG